MSERLCGSGREPRTARKPVKPARFPTGGPEPSHPAALAPRMLKRCTSGVQRPTDRRVSEEFAMRDLLAAAFVVLIAGTPAIAQDAPVGFNFGGGAAFPVAGLN